MILLLTGSSSATRTLYFVAVYVSIVLKSVDFNGAYDSLPGSEIRQHHVEPQILGIDVIQA